MNSLSFKPRSVLLFIGIGGIGKSTTACSFKVNYPGIKVLSSDDLRYNKFGYKVRPKFSPEEVLKEPLVKKEMRVRYAKYIKKGVDLILIDSTNLKQEERVKYTVRANTAKYNIYYLIFPLDVPKAIEQNKTREKCLDRSIIIKQFHDFEDPINDLVEGEIMYYEGIQK